MSRLACAYLRGFCVGFLWGLIVCGAIAAALWAYPVRIGE